MLPLQVRLGESKQLLVGRETAVLLGTSATTFGAGQQIGRIVVPDSRSEQKKRQE
ncbi:hypothetical protein GCM10023155_19540 [Bremerella cremea]